MQHKGGDAGRAMRRRIVHARTVTASVYVACPFSIAQEYVTDYLRRVASGVEEVKLHVPMQFLTSAFYRRVGLTFSIHADGLEGGRAHDEVRVRWTSGSKFLPEFCCTIRFRIAGAGTTVLVNGAYGPPLGASSRLFHAFFGFLVADVITHDLLSRIARFLESQQATWLAGRVTA